jgi:hypothetical protein
MADILQKNDRIITPTIIKVLKLLDQMKKVSIFYLLFVKKPILK